MLNDAALKNLKAKEKPYKVADRDGMYAQVSTAGSIVFRLDYRLHGRRETLTIGHYGRDGISLAETREECMKARKVVASGVSPEQEKQREKRRLQDAQTFGEFAERWFLEAPMADSTRDMRRSIYARSRTSLEQQAAQGNLAERFEDALLSDQGERRASHGRARARYHQADLRLRDPSRRKGLQSCGRSGHRATPNTRGDRADCA
jgi:Arm DNA-binding domain